MSLIGFQGLEALVAGLLATVGAVVALSLAVEVVRGGLAAAGRLALGRQSVPRTGKRQGRVAGPIIGDRVGPVEHSLLAREAWRLRC
jgi:hypothetical protein